MKKNKERKISKLTKKMILIWKKLLQFMNYLKNIYLITCMKKVVNMKSLRLKIKI